MDKNTLSNYGWVVIAVLVLSVMIALATPFGRFVADGFEATYTGFAHVANGEDGNKILQAAGMNGTANGGSGSGTETPDTPQEAPYQKNHYRVAYVLNGNAADNYGLTSTANLPAYIIVDKAITNYFAENEWVNDLTISEADFKAYAEKSFVSISDAQWETVKNSTFTHEYQSCRYENGNFIIHTVAASGDTDCSENVVGYTQNGETITVYNTVTKKNIVSNPYDMFNEADYGSYEEYDTAVQEYMTANGIKYNGMDDYFYTNTKYLNYIITYECEGLTNVKVYADKITSNDVVLENLKIKSMNIVDSTAGANAVAQPTEISYHFYSYGVYVRTESDEWSSWDVYDYYDFKVYPDAPTVAISCEYNVIPCGCNEFTISNRNITCKCGSFALTEAQLQSDWIGSDYIYE